MRSNANAPASRRSASVPVVEPTTPGYPATFAFDPPERVANWRPLVNWILAIPHFVILSALRTLSQVVGIISWFIVLFTGSMPEALANLQAMYMRYELRTWTYAIFMREQYPPFAFTQFRWRR